MDDIAINLARVRDIIATTATAAGRNAKEIKLIAVSKTHTAEAVDTALRAGQVVFAESTIQDAVPKIGHFQDRRLEWHFIGHLQSNKAKFIPGNFSWVHSLDSATLAQRLSRLAQDKNVVVNTLIEINIARDLNKHGIAPEQLFPFIEQLSKQDLPGIALRGLMAIGPHPAADAEVHAAFAAVRKLRDDAAQRFSLPGFTELSIGMSGDYVEAIKQGSTMVRIGTAIFGGRDYSK